MSIFNQEPQSIWNTLLLCFISMSALCLCSLCHPQVPPYCLQVSLYVSSSSCSHLYMYLSVLCLLLSYVPSIYPICLVDLYLVSWLCLSVFVLVCLSMFFSPTNPPPLIYC